MSFFGYGASQLPAGNSHTHAPLYQNRLVSFHDEHDRSAPAFAAIEEYDSRVKSEVPQSGAEPHFGKSETASRDWRGLGDLIDLATQRLTAPVEGIHDAIAHRWFGVAGRRAVPAGNVYRAVTAPVYNSVRLTGSALGTAVGLGAIAVASRNELRPLWRSPRGSAIQAFFNALWGDELERRGSTMSIEFGLRDSGGELIGLDANSLAHL